MTQSARGLQIARLDSPQDGGGIPANVGKKNGNNFGDRGVDLDDNLVWAPAGLCVLRDGIEQCRFANGLGQVRATSRGEAAVDGVLEGVGSEGKNRKRLPVV